MTVQNPIFDPANVNGYLLVNKPKGKTSFSLVSALRRRLGIQKIGHAGTLDPFATGVMVMLLGREYTKKSDNFLGQDKEYLAQIHLGVATDTYDCEGQVITSSDYVPTQLEVENAIAKFQGKIEQIPPMFSAKKINGQKLCDLARKGKTVERQASIVHVDTVLINYSYPFIDIQVSCSKGTYIRSIADDMGKLLGCGGHLSTLVRIRSGHFHLRDCVDGELLFNGDANLHSRILK